MDFLGREIDYVIMICGNFNACPVFIGGKNYFKNPLCTYTPSKGRMKKKIEQLREIRDEIGDWVQDFNYFMNGEANKLTITDCCEVIGDEKDGCCDLEGTNGDCCSSTDSTQDKKSN